MADWTLAQLYCTSHGWHQKKKRGSATDKQKQAMLQWYWNHEHAFTDARVLTNAKKMARATGSELVSMDEFLIEYGFKEAKKEKDISKEPKSMYSPGGIYLGTDLHATDW